MAGELIQPGVTTHFAKGEAVTVTLPNGTVVVTKMCDKDDGFNLEISIERAIALGFESRQFFKDESLQLLNGVLKGT